MFYSPWDADCTRAKEILEAVAKSFVDNDIYFAAVNCWEPKGQCNTEFNTSGGKPSKNPRLSQHQYPIFIFYPKDRRGIQYNGPISVQVIIFLKACYAFNLCIFQAMLDFLLVARKPLVHLGSRADLLNLRANHGGRVLVGYFPDLFASLKSRKVWRKFLDASYTFLEQDPFQNSIGGMGVVTSQNVALTLQLDASRPIRWDTTAHTLTRLPQKWLEKLSPFIFVLIIYESWLCRYFFTNGSSVAYPNKTISSTQSLMSWTRHHQVNHPSLVTWIGTAGRKSLNLARKLENNSKHSLLVFLNRKHRYFFFNFPRYYLARLDPVNCTFLRELLNHKSCLGSSGGRIMRPLKQCKIWLYNTLPVMFPYSKMPQICCGPCMSSKRVPLWLRRRGNACLILGSSNTFPTLSVKKQSHKTGLSSLTRIFCWNCPRNFRLCDLWLIRR